MELRHVQAFVAVAEELHFGRAADRLRLSPSPVSRTIAELERQIGVPLFIRGHHSVSLTAAGAGLLDQARGLLNAWGEFLVHGRDYAHDAALPTIRFGAPTLASTMVVDRLLEEVTHVRPGVHVDVRFASSTELLHDLIAGELDLAIMLLPVDDPRVLTIPLARYEFSLAMRDDDDLASRDLVSSADLAGRRVLLSSHAVQQSAVQTVSQWLTDLGAIVDLLPDADLIHISQLVRRGRGLTLSSASGASTQIFSQPGLTTVPLDCPVPGIDLGIASRPGFTSAHLWSDLAARLATITGDKLLRT